MKSILILLKGPLKCTLPKTMKHIILLLSFFALSRLAYSQNLTNLGIKAGISNSGVRGDAVESLNQLVNFTNGIVSTSDRTGFFAGGYVNVPLSEHVSIEPGIYYSQKGYQLKGGFDIKGVEFLGANAKADLQTQYIDVPLYLKASWNGLQVFAGPQVSYLADANLKATAGILGINLLNKDVDVSDILNKWDASVSAGIGYQFANGLNISASYDYGLMKIDADKRTNAFNRGFKVGLGVQF